MVDGVRLPIIVLSADTPATPDKKKPAEKTPEPIPAREREALPKGIPATGAAPIDLAPARESTIIDGLVEEVKQIKRERAAGVAPVQQPERPQGPIFDAAAGALPSGRVQARTRQGGALPQDRTTGAPAPIESEWKKMQRENKEQAIKLRDLARQQRENVERISKTEGILSKGANVLTNPAGAVSDQVLQMLQGLGPKGQLAVAAISAVVAAPETIRQIIKILGQKGLPLNRDWTREFGGTASDFFSVEENKLRLIGRDAYVVTEQAQFQPQSGAEVYNSLENRDEVIISKLGSYDKALGVT